MKPKNVLNLVLFLFILLQTNPVLSNPDNWSYYVHDHQGNTRVVMDDAGGIKSWYDYYPYGLIQRASIAGSDARFKFTGKEFDSEDDLDLYYFGARYYDPVIGRFLSVDPARFKWSTARLQKRNLLGMSPYVYVRNNPLILVDPNGYVDYPALGKAAATFVAGLGGIAGGYVIAMGSGGAAAVGGGLLSALGAVEAAEGFENIGNALIEKPPVDSGLEQIGKKLGGELGKKIALGFETVVGLATGKGAMKQLVKKSTGVLVRTSSAAAVVGTVDGVIETTGNIVNATGSNNNSTTTQSASSENGTLTTTAVDQTSTVLKKENDK